MRKTQPKNNLIYVTQEISLYFPSGWRKRSRGKPGLRRPLFFHRFPIIETNLLSNDSRICVSELYQINLAVKKKAILCGFNRFIEPQSSVHKLHRPPHTLLAVSFPSSGVEDRNRGWGEPSLGVPINQGPPALYVHQTNRNRMIRIPGG